MSNLRLFIIGLVVLSGAMLAADFSSAHHSFNMFDRTQHKLLVGRVTSWNFNNPHSWLYLEAVDEDGALQTWSLEGASPVHAVRQGVNGTTYRKDEVVRVVMAPLKNGRPAGAMCFVVKENEDITFPNDAVCNAAGVVSVWQDNGWLMDGSHLDVHSATPAP